MSSKHKNLSEHSGSNIPDGSRFHIAIIVSEWNTEITEALLEGTRMTLIQNGVKEKHIDVHYVPGTFELPVAAQMALTAKSKLDAVICIGCVVQGETRHFDFICQAAADGIKDVSLKFNKPVIFGVLTPNNQQQALDRAGGKYGNKGIEAAVTALKMADLAKKL
jgi:6,7-dimethyl-8-ribityllumazine synthase